MAHILDEFISQPESEPVFYKRTLPDSCVSFSSREGKTIFEEALLSGHMECYFKLASQFRTQDEPAFCGLSTLVMVLNALEIDPGKVWKRPWRWYHESMLNCCVPIAVMEKEGITMDQFISMAENNCLETRLTYVDETASLKAFRTIIHNYTKQDESVITLSYSRSVLSQTGDGHFSPVGGYHPSRDLVLILDTARFKYPPYWVPVSLLFEAMQAKDNSTEAMQSLTNPEDLLLNVNSAIVNPYDGFAHGAQGIRQYHRKDEEKILPHKRACYDI
ncbi:E2.3.2.15 [Mytilus edulis]|uniref:glutathione gamma-glutamylcysteinyltransferase n=1 Tax=Mytilus edulis TaxID=6550 RepID=A0A8S3REL8_MYTED|nr:E2.3.2.15 [Mytilus edulis]